MSTTTTATFITTVNANRTLFIALFCLGLIELYLFNITTITFTMSMSNLLLTFMGACLGVALSYMVLDYMEDKDNAHCVDALSLDNRERTLNMVFAQEDMEFEQELQECYELVMAECLDDSTDAYTEVYTHLHTQYLRAQQAIVKDMVAQIQAC